MSIDGQVASVRRRRVSPTVVGAAASLVAALVVLAPWLAPGSLLVRDLVAVAMQPGWGTHLLRGGVRLARDVPGEVLAAGIGQVVGGDWVVRVGLLVAMGAVGAAVGRLLRDRSSTAVVVAAVSAVVNPWTWAHLRQGQWLVVVAYAAVGYVALAVADDDVLGTIRAVTAAALSGVVAVVVVWPTLIVTGLCTRRWRALAVGSTTAFVTALPWALLPGPRQVDRDGFAAFAANADTPFGVWTSLLTGGGYFNALVASPWRRLAPIAVLATLLAGVGLVRVARHARSAPANDGAARAAGGLIVTGLVGVVVAGLGASSWGSTALAELGTWWPGVAILRDTHRLLAPLVLASAIGLGLVAEDVASRLSGAGMTRPRIAAGVAAVAICLVVVALPDPVVGPRLPGPSTLPASWVEAAALVDAAGDPGGVLVVPHAQVQQYAFTQGRPVAVPWRRMVDRRVLVGSELVVGDQVIDDGVDDTWAELAGQPPATWTATAMAAAGVSWIVVTEPAAAAQVRDDVGLEVVVSDDDLMLVRVDAPIDPAPLAPPVGGWILWLDAMVLVVAMALLAPLRRRDTGSVARYHTVRQDPLATPNAPARGRRPKGTT